MDLLEKRLSEVLASRSRRVVADAGLKRSAVLVPIFHKGGEHHLLFTKRTETVKYHKGQICFPGGGYGKEDGALLNTALRESREEIGLLPGDVEILGALDDEPTWVSGYVITPFVGVMPWPYELKINRREIQEIVEVPLVALLDKANVRTEREYLGGEPADAYFYSCMGKVVWGATARILNGFLGLLTDIIKDEPWSGERLSKSC